MKFTPIRPSNFLQFDFTLGSNEDFSESNFHCNAVNNRGTVLPFTRHFQEHPRSEESNRIFRVYLFFEIPLMPNDPGQPYFVDYQYEVPDPFPTLGRESNYSIVGSWAYADEITLMVAFPREKFTNVPVCYDIATRSREQLTQMGCDVELEKLVPSKELPIMEFIHLMELDQPREKYFLMGRVVKDTKPDQAFGFVIE